ncbi:MAG: hypothetical protein NTV17_14750, partial [Burkholderiales bacterium]|nr:hypothetical protein [Burkholderiales bacterium]
MTSSSEHPPRRRTLPLAAAMAGLLLSASLMSACGARSTDALLDQAKTALSKQDIKTAEIHLKNLLQQQPDNPDARIMLAEVHRANRDERSAEKE